MRIAALYDIHGNVAALEAVLADVAASDVDLIVIGGDVVAGPFPRPTLERLLQLEQPAVFVRGNADREVAGALDAEPQGIKLAPPELTRWAAQQLDARQLDMLASWPLLQRADVDGIGATLFCHASPRNDTDIFTRVTPDQQLLPLLSGVSESTIVVGHTHMQFERNIGGKRLLNAGSVGMPYNGSGAYWLLLGPGVEFRRTDYDLQAAAEAVRAGGYPQAESFAATNILNPPDEAQVFAAFEKLAAKLNDER